MEDFKMKKSFLKFLPLMAAVMLTTACSKDDENQDMVSPDNKEQIAKGELIPFSIKVATNHKLSKAGSFSEDKDKNIDIAFHANDVNTLKMTLQNSVDFGQVAYLTLTNINGTFEGEIPASWVGQTIKASVGLLNGSAISSDKGLLELMGKCNHPLEGVFKVGTNDILELTDQNAYFEIKMSPLQHKLDVSINGAKKTVDLSKDGIVWIAVNTSSYSFADFKTNFYTKAQDNIKPGQIYTINREGFVDLGFLALSTRAIDAFHVRPGADEIGFREVDFVLAATGCHQHGNREEEKYAFHKIISLLHVHRIIRRVYFSAHIKPGATGLIGDIKLIVRGCVNGFGIIPPTGKYNARTAFKQIHVDVPVIGSGIQTGTYLDPVRGAVGLDIDVLRVFHPNSRPFTNHEGFYLNPGFRVSLTTCDGEVGAVQLGNGNILIFDC